MHWYDVQVSVTWARGDRGSIIISMSCLARVGLMTLSPHCQPCSIQNKTIFFSLLIKDTFSLIKLEIVDAHCHTKKILSIRPQRFVASSLWLKGWPQKTKWSGQFGGSVSLCLYNTSLQREERVRRTDTHHLSLQFHVI